MTVDRAARGPRRPRTRRRARPVSGGRGRRAPPCVGRARGTGARVGSPVAVSPADRLVERLGVVDALAGRGSMCSLPDDADWRERLPVAALGHHRARCSRSRRPGSLALAARVGLAARASACSHPCTSASSPSTTSSPRSPTPIARRRRRAAAERAHVGRRPEPHRRPRDDPDPRRARSRARSRSCWSAERASGAGAGSFGPWPRSPPRCRSIPLATQADR